MQSEWSHSVVSDSLRPVDCSPPSSTVHGILQARILQWVAISFSRGSSQPKDWTQVSHIAGRHFNLRATREAPKNLLIWKDPDAGKDWRWEEKGTTEDEMVGWHHQLNGPPGVGDGQGNLACYNPLGCKESDMTDWLNWTEALRTSQVVLVVKNPPVNAGRYNRRWFDPWIGKIPRGRHGYPLQYSYLENPMDRGAWQSTVHRVAKSGTWLKVIYIKMWTFRFTPGWRKLGIPRENFPSNISNICANIDVR